MCRWSVNWAWRRRTVLGPWRRAVVWSWRRWSVNRAWWRSPSTATTTTSKQTSQQTLKIKELAKSAEAAASTALALAAEQRIECGLGARHEGEENYKCLQRERENNDAPC